MINFRNTYCFLTFITVFLFTACEEETLGNQNFGSLEGKVVSNGLNTPLENVKITTNPASTTVFTDSNGNFKIDDISVGDFSVKAEKDDFETAFEPVNIFTGKTTNVVFELDSTSSKNLQPKVPNLIFPEDKSTKVSSPVRFVWSSSANDNDEINYTLEVRNGNTNEIQLFESIIDTVFTVENLSIGTNYFWQVTATDEVTTPVQSKISSFQLQGVEDNRFLYVRNVEGNNVIFSGGEPTGSEGEEINQNEIQLTSVNINAYRPKANRLAGKIAYIRSVGGESHIFTMNFDGTEQKQLTKEIPIAGFNQNEVEFTWNNNGSAIYYPNFNKLYTINIDGSGNTMVYETVDEEFITEIAINPTNSEVVLKLNDVRGYNVQLRIITPSSTLGSRTIISGLPGAFGGLDYSLDGNKILYTWDVSGTENAQYRQLDSRIFEYDLQTNTSTEIETEKPTGFNNLDAKYSPNGGFIIFTYTSNDGISQKNIYRKQLDVTELIEKELIFMDASMANWE